MPNPYHDARGRFTTKGGARSTSGSPAQRLHKSEPSYASTAMRRFHGGGKHVQPADLKIGDTVTLSDGYRGSHGRVASVTDVKGGETVIRVNTSRDPRRPDYQHHRYVTGRDTGDAIYRAARIREIAAAATPQDRANRKVRSAERRYKAAMQKPANGRSLIDQSTHQQSRGFTLGAMKRQAADGGRRTPARRDDARASNRYTLKQEAKKQRFGWPTYRGQR